MLLVIRAATKERGVLALPERQAEGIAAAKTRGVYKGRRRTLTPDQIRDLADRATAGESKTALAKEFRISRETVYQYLRANPTTPR